MSLAARPVAVDQAPERIAAAAGPPAAPGEAFASDRVLALLSALADPNRLQVVQALAQGERCVCELTSELALAQSKLSFHLKVLKQAGLLASRQQGRWVYYRLQPELLLSLADWLGELSARCDRPAAACS